MIKRRFIIAVSAIALAASACTTTSNTAAGSKASKRATIDTQAEGAMSKLYVQVPGSRELVAKSRGVLVFPSIISAGFVIGGSYGQGVLLEGSKETGYYSTATASAGLLAGADSKAVYLLFLTQDALDRFKASNGWTAGVDAQVTAVTVGANGSIDTNTARSPVVSFTLSNGGLMGSLSVEGTKITKLML